MIGLPGHIGPLLIASALLSAGIALAVPGLIGTLAARAAPAVRARAMSFYTFSLFIGASIAPPVAQALAPYGWFALLSTSAMALACAAAVIGGQPAPPSDHSVSETPSP